MTLTMTADTRWTNDKRVAAVRKWHLRWSDFSREATDLLLAALAPAPGWRVLDLASGAGDPALMLARAVGPGGHVKATDLTLHILVIGEEDARRDGLSNLNFRQASAEELPFPDASFDAITCRFGIMFVADVARALRECRRVLRPGGHAVFLAWGPLEGQPYFESTIAVVQRRTGISTEQANFPQMFRFADPEMLRHALEDVGLAPASAEIRSITLCWPGTTEELWEYFSETSSTFRPVIDALPPNARADLARECCALLRRHREGGIHRFPAQVVLAIGARS